MHHSFPISLAVGVLLGVSYVAHATNPDEPVWLDSKGHVVRDGRGECVRTMYWTAANMIEACGGKPAPVMMAPPAPKPVPAPVAQPAPAPKPMPVAPSAPKPVTLRGDTSFRSGSSELSPAARAEIAGVVGGIRKMSKVTAIRVAGHTDSSGPDAANQSLSEARANAVRDALIEDGIDGALISATGYGESRPIADNATAAGRASNRRVEIEIDGY